MNNLTPVIQCRALTKSFRDGELSVDVLSGIDFQIAAGEQVAIVGSSGAGKSTFLQILGGLDKPTSGEVLINGHAIHKLTEKSRCQLRNDTLGFVYQFHHLLPEFTVLENVCMPLLIRKVPVKEAQDAAIHILEKVGLLPRQKHKLGELSGGERQRTAIARALVTKPKCLLADEPTGNLDYRTADKVYETMLELNQEFKTSFIIVTHDMRMTERMGRTLMMEAGRLV